MIVSVSRPTLTAAYSECGVSCRQQHIAIAGQQRAMWQGKRSDGKRGGMHTGHCGVQGRMALAMCQLWCAPM
eukprot:scaffold33208_cov20-Tisochrysis_lutea.AAC.1